jgi:serine/threonine protein kinase
LDGRYRTISELGHGGFGTAYEAIDFNHRPWVLKVLTDNHPKYVELFQQEAEILGILNHSGIPKIDLDGYFTYFPRGQEEPLHCLVMEKIEGLNLAEYIKQRGDRPIKPKRALRWLAELTLILEQIHQHNFFHRDIKPSNIMLKANGCLVMIDFGTVREITQSYINKKAAGEITGVVTHGYTPIEQMRGKAVFQSDFYALGGTMIFLLTAQNPCNFYNYLEDRFDWHQAATDVPFKFAKLIDRMVAFSPANRPASAREMFNEIITIDPSLQILDEHFNSSKLESNTVPKTAITYTPVHSSNPVTPEFIERCRLELAGYIGPMANIICKRVIRQIPNASQAELCAALAQSISNPQQAKDFQQRLT